jgi:hypothetical protein
MAPGVIAAAAAAAERHKRIVIADRVWSAYAQAHGLHYRPGREGWARTEMPRLDGAVGNVAVALELVDDPWDPRAFVVAALARPVVPLVGHVEVHREGILSRIAEAFGAHDIAVGEDAFDRAFVVKATDESTARALLPPNVTRELLALGAKSFAYDDGSENSQGAIVVANFPFQTEDFGPIDRALAFVALVAQIRPASGPYR